MKPMVIAVGGYSGAGKSTVVARLASQMNGAALYFDDYASRSDFPEDIPAWLRDGSDPNAISAPLLREHLLQLMDGQSVELVKGNGWAKEYGVNPPPAEVKAIAPSSIIFIEEPFGRERDELRDLIDMVVYLELKPEIALARRVHDLNRYLRHDPDVLLNLLDRFLFDYLYGGVREMYVTIGDRVKFNSDLIIHANRSIDTIIEEICDRIGRK